MTWKIDNNNKQQINQLQHPAKQEKQKIVAKAEKKKNPAKSKEKTEEEIHFDFYEILPEVEIEPNISRIPENKKVSTTNTVTSKQSVSSKKSTASQKSNKADLYQLQISAFQTKEKAESLKAQLAFMGVQSNISSRLTSKGQKLFRVRIGPTSNKQNLIKIKRSLEKRNFKPFLQKI